ncbi:UNVERIFIED_CONTAM: peroxidase [Mumia flava]
MLVGAAALGGAGVGGVAGAGLARASAADVPAADAAGQRVVSPYGAHQAGIATPAQGFATLVAFDLVARTDRDALVRLMRIWSDDIGRLCAGRAGLSDTEPELAQVPAALTITLGYGPGLFTAARLESERPSWLAPLPPFGVDRLEDRWNGGDVLLQVCADDPTTVAHAVRLLTKEARTFTTVRWVQHGFRRAPGSTPPGTSMRNLMGQVDGTHTIADDEMDGLVWVGDRSAEWFGAQPAWLEGGTSLVVRRIAMNLDTWDELDAPAREDVIGRRLADGAPLTGGAEHDDVDLDAVGDNGLPVIGAYAHVRRARSDDPHQRFLRRPYSYDAAPTGGALSDSGLIFATYQADVTRQFTPIQQRLDELDLLNQWTTPVGSAVFAVPPGFEQGGWLGEPLLG